MAPLWWFTIFDLPIKDSDFPYEAEGSNLATPQTEIGFGQVNAMKNHFGDFLEMMGACSSWWLLPNGKKRIWEYRMNPGWRWLAPIPEMVGIREWWTSRSVALQTAWLTKWLSPKNQPKIQFLKVFGTLGVHLILWNIEIALSWFWKF